MISTKTNRLSIDRLYSVSQPATNCPATSPPAYAQSTPAKISARVT